MRILSVDPSMTHTGYVVLELKDKKTNLLDYDVIITKPEKKVYVAFDNIRRFQEIYMELKRLHKKWDYKAVLAEIPSGTQNAKAAVAFGGVASILGCLVKELDLVSIWHLQRNVKLALCGKAGASKKDMKLAAADIFPESIEKFVSSRARMKIHGKKVKNDYEHVADAIAVYRASLKRDAFNMLILMSQKE